MAQYTVNTGPGEEQFLDFIVARRAAWGLPPLTKDQIVGLLFHGKLQEKFDETRGDDTNRTYNALQADTTTEQQKAQVRAILGLP